MKDEYDFSEAERGRCHKPDAKMNIPVYLESEVQEFIMRIAKAKKLDSSAVVNELLRSDMHLADVMS